MKDFSSYESIVEVVVAECSPGSVTKLQPEFFF